MKAASGGPGPSPTAPDIDENAVDRTRIRGMLALMPGERPRPVEGFVQSTLELRELDATRPLP